MKFKFAIELNEREFGELVQKAAPEIPHAFIDLVRLGADLKKKKGEP